MGNNFRWGQFFGYQLILSPEDVKRSGKFNTLLSLLVEIFLSLFILVIIFVFIISFSKDYVKAFNAERRISTCRL